MTAWLLPTRAATALFGEALGRRLRAGHVVALEGELGAGKTTLAQSVARGLGITAYVSSPTFGLVHEYAGSPPMFHFDPYRLRGSDGLVNIGFHDYFDRGAVILIEWADKVPDVLPAERLTLRIEAHPQSAGGSDEDEPRRLEAHAVGVE
jgi:tRNA threonylcarbamoyladenosine biosynthesis protein TsaE